MQNISKCAFPKSFGISPLLISLIQDLWSVTCFLLFEGRYVVIISECNLWSPSVKSCIFLEVTRKKLLYDVYIGSLLCLDSDILGVWQRIVSTGKMSHEGLKVWPVNLMGMMAAGRWRWEGEKLKSVCQLFEWRLLYIIEEAGRKEIKLLEPMSEA